MIKNAIHAFLKRRGLSSVKQRIWDSEYSAGKWDFPRAGDPGQEGSRDIVLGVIERHCQGGDILDLGCGGGATGLEIAPVYRRYVGVDVSQVAVLAAQSEVLQDAARRARNEYAVSDILSFVPKGKFRVILFRESVYYVPIHQIKTMLQRYSLSLASDGTFIVRLHDRAKYRKIIAFIERHYRVTEVIEAKETNGVVLVFSPIS